MCHKVWNPNPRTTEENLALLADRVETPQDAAALEVLTELAQMERLGAAWRGEPDPEPFALIAEVHDVAVTEPDATLTLGWTDQSFTRPVSRRERALRAHAATEAARLQGGADTLV